MSFPEPHIIIPKSTHTHTIILLHGRGSNGLEFAEDLFSLKTSQNQTLESHLPNWRWVFPTSKDRWSTTFKEDLTAWFDIVSTTDPSERPDLQSEGLMESTIYIQDLVKREIELLGGDSRRLVLGGMSQGMATALSASGIGAKETNMGGFVGFCGWMPFAAEIEDGMRRTDQEMAATDAIRRGEYHTIQSISPETAAQVGDAHRRDLGIVPSTPVLLIHGTDDTWVNVELGRQACRVLRRMGLDVDWNEYAGAENDGHWIKGPEGFDKILEFLKNVALKGVEGGAPECLK